MILPADVKARSEARALADVAAEYGVSWWSVQHALVVKAAAALPDLQPVRLLGLDETRARALRCSFSRPAGVGRSRG